MGISKMLYTNRLVFLVIVALFYSTAVVFVVQLARLDSSNSIVPALRTLSNKPSNVNMSLSDDNKTLITMTKHLSSVGIILNNTPEYVDWNDYELMAKDAQRHGLGEQGTAFNMSLSSQEQKLSSQLMAQYKFNAFASDHISLERSIGDIRTDVCKTKRFLKNLPEALVSIIIIFYNEKNASVLRSLHSIVNRSPARLLREIVLVDDFSSNEELQDPLENYIRLHFPKVRLIRNAQRQGLIKSRMIGANATSGDILLFLDAHVEVNHNFLPPLVEPIVLDYRKIVCPMMDNIKFSTLQIIPLERRNRGVFSWDMVYRRLPVYQEDETIPHPVPIMMGAAFAISRKWWEEIGMYDTDLEIWGGEQYEISFKSWQCGGSVVDAPCSRVAHLFRKLPYVKDVEKNLLDRNFLRVCRVWMDEYIEYVFNRRPNMRQIDPGDLIEQHAIRKRLQCKSFKWYLTEVAPDILQYFPPVEPPDKAWGHLRSRYNSSLCILTGEKGFYLGKCAGSKNGYYMYDWRQHIHFYKNCFANPGERYIFMFECLFYELNPSQSFVWDPFSGRVVNLYTRLCIDVDVQTMKVYTTQCDDSKVTQSWTFSSFNSTLVEEAWEKYRVELGM